MKGKTVSPQCFPANLITNQSGCNTCTIMAPGDNSTADVNTHGGSRNGRGSSWLPKFCSVESILEEGRVSRRSSSEVFIKNPGRKSTPVHHPGDPGGGGLGGPIVGQHLWGQSSMVLHATAPKMEAPLPLQGSPILLDANRVIKP